MMEADLLRPKIIPVSDEIQWFEFLLDKELLEKHLTKKDPHPTAEKLIGTLIQQSIIPENQQSSSDLNSPDVDPNKNEGLLFGRKQLALKILALKVSAFLKWNLAVLERCLPIQKQVQILGDLCSITSGRIVNIPLSLVHEVPIPNETNRAALNFALTLYHRWVLRAQVLKGSYTKIKPFVHVVSTPEQTNGYSIQDDLFIASLEPCTPSSIEFLNQIINDPEPFKILNFNSFTSLDSRGEIIPQKFENTTTITKTELKAQIHYDLGFYYMFIKKYDLAKENIMLCRDHLAKLKEEYSPKLPDSFEFCNIDEDELRGYLLACGVFDEKPSLMMRMHTSIQNKYEDIIDILKEDNLSRQIPIIQRKMLEMDIEALVSNQKFNKEMEFQVVALNALRYVLDENDILSSDTFRLKYKNDFVKIMEYFIEYSNENFSKLVQGEINALKKYLLDIFLTNTNDKIEILLKKSACFQKKELDMLKQQKFEFVAPALSAIATKPDWNVVDSKIKRVEVGIVERQLISTINPNIVRKLLVRLASMNPTQPLWTINNNWSVPMVLKQIVSSFPPGFLQDFSFILLAKARELTAKRDYQSAISMLSVLKNEIARTENQSSAVTKLGKLVGWEISHVQSVQCLDEWPKKPTDQAAWIKNLKLVLQPLQAANSPDIPRVEIVDNTIMILLNLNEWSSCILTDVKRDPILELCSLLASIMADFEKFKHGQPSKKLNVDMWNLILPIFNQQSAQSQMKRSASVSGRSAAQSNEPQSSLTLQMFKQFVDKLRDPTLITVVLSLLAKIHNVLKDESNFDLTIDHLHLWPASISNANAYNIKLVSETLNHVLKLAFKYYPNNTSWLKLKGDLEFVNGNNEIAMKNYVHALMVLTEYCTLQIQRPLLDDYVVKKMIKCCQNLGCNMQAAVMCQFLDEIDYQLAFKCISEKTSNFADAMDSYYSCIWDPTLLEFIVNLHYKRGEHKRRLQAITIMSQLELNSNNNDEIKREAASIRKIKFLRSLSRQYM